MGRHLLSGAWRISNTFIPSPYLTKIVFSPFHSRFSCSQRLGISITSHRFPVITNPPAQSFKAHKGFYTTMASGSAAPQGQSIPAIETLSLQSTSEQSKFPDCYPSLNPVDIYREHIAENLGKASGIDPLTIFQRLNWTNTLEKGDLVLPVLTVSFEHLAHSLIVSI